MKTVMKQIQAGDLETRLNLLLRRADWRFFMPSLRPETSLSLAKGLLDQSVKEISGRMVDPANFNPGECNLAVAIDPGRGQLHTVHEALCPGGGFYSEWYRPIYGGPDGIRGRLEQAGFCDIQFYWPWPLPGQNSPVFWLPIEQDDCLDYFLSTRPLKTSFQQKLLDFSFRWVWQSLRKARLLIPVCAAARKPSPASFDEHPFVPADNSNRTIPSNGLLEAVREDYHRYGFEQRPEGLTWLLLTGGQRRVSKVVAPVFVQGEKTPRFILKMNRVPEGRERLQNEAMVLKAIKTRGEDILGNMPYLLFTLEYEDVFAIAESICSGQPVFTLLDRDSYREIALSVSGWLARLAKNTSSSPQPGAVRAYLQSVLADFEINYQDIISPGEIEACRTLFTRLEDLPFVCEHRDCTPWNWIQSTQGHYALLDWEDATLKGLPAVDLIFFLNNLALFFEGTFDEGDFQDTYRNAQAPGRFTGKIHEECFYNYFEELGLEPAVLEPLRLFTWTLHANLQYQRYILAHGALPDLEWIKEKFYPNFWKAEIAQVFIPVR
jgi:hypothetical protein